MTGKLKLPAFLSQHAGAFLKALLHKDPLHRLGSGAGGADDIKHHPFFKGVNWKKMEAREVGSPCRPSVGPGRMAWLP